MATAIKSQSLKPWRAFTAVGLVTLAALAALFRAMDYVAGVVAFVFPFNTTLMTITFGVTAVCAAVIIRKTGVFTLFTLAAQLINVFVQGETPVAGLVMLLWGVLADLFVYYRLKSGVDPFSNLRDMIISCILMGIVWVVTVYAILFPIIYLVQLSTFIYIALMVVGWIGVVVGGVLGFYLGNRIKGLLG
jgi:hypothetical protein